MLQLPFSSGSLLTCPPSLPSLAMAFTHQSNKMLTCSVGPARSLQAHARCQVLLPHVALPAMCVVMCMPRAVWYPGTLQPATRCQLLQSTAYSMVLAASLRDAMANWLYVIAGSVAICRQAAMTLALCSGCFAYPHPPYV